MNIRGHFGGTRHALTGWPDGLSAAGHRRDLGISIASWPAQLGGPAWERGALAVRHRRTSLGFAGLGQHAAFYQATDDPRGGGGVAVEQRSDEAAVDLTGLAHNVDDLAIGLVSGHAVILHGRAEGGDDASAEAIGPIRCVVELRVRSSRGRVRSTGAAKSSRPRPGGWVAAQPAQVMVCSARLSCRSPWRLRRCRTTRPEEASRGATPPRAAKAASPRQRPA